MPKHSNADSSSETNSGKLSGPRNARDSGKMKRKMNAPKSNKLDPRNNTSNTPKGFTRGI